jgi:hypothetical protein
MVWASFHVSMPNGPVIVLVDVLSSGEVSLVR